jgi:hypothetical protein
MNKLTRRTTVPFGRSPRSFATQSHDKTVTIGDADLMTGMRDLLDCQAGFAARAGACKSSGVRLDPGSRTSTMRVDPVSTRERGVVTRKFLPHNAVTACRRFWPFLRVRAADRVAPQAVQLAGPPFASRRALAMSLYRIMTKHNCLTTEIPRPMHFAERRTPQALKRTLLCRRLLPGKVLRHQPRREILDFGTN